MAQTIGARHAARLTELAAHTRAGGLRGLRARRAWRQLVRACAAGDPAAQDAIREAAVPDSDALELLAGAPAEPADRAAYLVLIGQHAHHAALDPDGTLLALAYRAAPPDVRARLRAALAAAGDSEVIRVVVTGEGRDRLGELTYDELDYVHGQLTQRQDWDGLRRLARDLPLAGAAATAALLPPGERRGPLLDKLAGQPAGRLRALVERLPAKAQMRYRFGYVGRGGHLRASFSADLSELAIVRTIMTGLPRDRAYRFDVSTLRIGTGVVTHRCGWTWTVPHELDSAVFHLGDEIFVRTGQPGRPDQLVRAVPDHVVLDLPDFAVSDMCPASGGAVMLGATGLLFVDRGANKLRYQRISGLREATGYEGATTHIRTCGLTTLPSAGLVAFSVGTDILVVNEDGALLHTLASCQEPGPAPQDRVTLTFPSPGFLAVEQRGQVRTWELPPHGDPRLVDVRQLLYPAAPEAEAVAWTPWGDILVSRAAGPEACLVVRSPHLPAARDLLARPLALGSPQWLRQIEDVRSVVGDAEVDSALVVLHGCLQERSGGDIALGATGPVAAGGATDIALGESGAG
ncbi:hypothetical protein [Streptomyces sp. UG1]|uniref:hypothetical protein n=1 Tax=Streptomyces sp. UG1 TaxID=3417652 RepID=UPI003CF12F26